MKKLIFLAMTIGVLSVGNIASAVSIEPSLGLLPVAGEAEFNSLVPLILPGQAYVDWIVFNPADYSGGAFSGLVFGITGSSTLSEYLYVYQIEARGSPALTDIENLTVYFNTSLVSGFGDYFADLDTWHNSGNFANLATEGETAGASIETVKFGPVIHPTNITWDFDGTLDAGEESEVAWIRSPIKPVYVFAAISDTAVTGGRIPAPTPEPASMALVGLGLLGFAGKVARRKFKA